MTITTAAPVQTTTTPNAADITTLNDAGLASGIERGIIAAGILERMVPAGVRVEEHNLGAKRTTRGVFLHEGGEDQIALYFLDATAEVSVHIACYEDGRTSPVHPGRGDVRHGPGLLRGLTMARDPHRRGPSVCLPPESTPRLSPRRCLHTQHAFGTVDS